MLRIKNNPHGIDLGPMKSCLPERLFTADKTINLAPDVLMSELKKLDVFFNNDKAASGQARFDLQLIGRRDPRTNNSWLHNSYRMVKGKNRCLVLIHPQDAEARQLLDGDMATVSSRVGSIRIPVAISDEMKPGVISIPHGWGHRADGIKLGIAQQHAGVNTNILTDDQFLDSLSGNAVLNGIKVSITKESQQK